MPKHVMVVDDDMDTQDILRQRFESAGYRVSTAFDGLHVFDLLEDSVPDLILMDVMMPLMNGFKTTRLIKGNPKWERIPIIMLTARTTKRDRDTGLAAGAQEYVVKPFDLEGLFRMAELILKALEKPDAT